MDPPFYVFYNLHQDSETPRLRNIKTSIMKEITAKNILSKEPVETHGTHRALENPGAPETPGASETQPFDYSRYDFLKTAGSATIMAFFGITLASCSSSVTDSGTGTDPDPTDPDPTDPGDGGDGTSPITIEGDLVTLNLDSSRFEGLKSAGGWNLIEEAELLVVNVDGQVIRAFTSVCTHQQCKTSWQFSNDLFICTCHDSRFNTSGEVTSGPAQSDLQEYAVTRDGSTVTIDKS